MINFNDSRAFQLWHKGTSHFVYLAFFFSFDSTRFHDDHDLLRKYMFRRDVCTSNDSLKEAMLQALVFLILLQKTNSIYELREITELIFLNLYIQPRSGKNIEKLTLQGTAGNADVDRGWDGLSTSDGISGRCSEGGGAENIRGVGPAEK